MAPFGDGRGEPSIPFREGTDAESAAGHQNSQSFADDRRDVGHVEQFEREAREGDVERLSPDGTPGCLQTTDDRLDTLACSTAERAWLHMP